MIQAISEKYNPEFANTVKVTLEYEGYFSDDQDDRGGATKFGISQSFLNAIKYHKKAIELTKDNAIELYYQHFWLKCNCELLHPGVALMLFDYAVHSGVPGACKELQRVLSYEPEINLAIDGIIGNKTIKALNTVIQKTGGYETVVQGLATKRGELFFNIIKKRENQAKFYRGWFKRLWRITEIAQGLNR